MMNARYKRNIMQPRRDCARVRRPKPGSLVFGQVDRSWLTR